MKKNFHPNLVLLMSFLLPTTVLSLGCAMCCGPYDYDYPGYGGGGRIQRADPVYGRVGSIFSDANMAGMGPLSDSNIVDPEMEPLKTIGGQDKSDTPSPDLPGSGNLPSPTGDRPGEMLPQPPRIPTTPAEDLTDRQTLNRWRPSQRTGNFR